MRIIGFVIFAFIFLNSSVAQDTSYAHEVLYELSAKKYRGRGYYKNGSGKAAKYISDEMEKAGLIKLETPCYYQSFQVTANNVKKVKIKINKHILKPGVEYIVNGSSPIKRDKFSGIVPFLGPNQLMNETSVDSLFATAKHLVVIDTIPTGSNLSQRSIIAKAKKQNIRTLVLLQKGKLTYSVAQNQEDLLTIVYISRPSLRKELVELGNWESFKIVVNSELNNFVENNVMGMIKGKNQDSTIIVCGHYDHLGQMGKNATFYGANDNACGIAMLLDMAKYFKKNQPKYNMLFIAFAGEELGLVGSRHYVENPIIPLSQTKFVLNLDLVGTGHKGMTVVNATVFPEYFKKLTSINDQYNYLPQITRRGKAANSDHYFFTEVGIPSFFGYFQGDRSSYHDVFDIPETLPLTRYVDGRSLFIKFLEAI